MQKLTWNDIKQRVGSLSKVDGGFSPAHRGIMRLASGEQIFVKVGVDESTKKWAKKEIETYRFLERAKYKFIPVFLACDEQETSFALEALTTENGWDWTTTWSEPRLIKTLESLDELAKIIPKGTDKDFFSFQEFGDIDDGWSPLEKSEELQNTLVKKLKAAGFGELASKIDFSKMVKKSKAFHFRHDTLVHHDVRADNCAWNEKINSVKLVDWNWTQLGDRRIDLNSLLVSVHKSGLDVSTNYSSLINRDALFWLAGFWFKAACTPIWIGGPTHLRNLQLHSGITALQLAKF